VGTESSPAFQCVNIGVGGPRCGSCAIICPSNQTCQDPSNFKCG
jgi:hypothetical protein